MDSTIEHSGACLCGAVRVRAKTEGSKIGVCHCSTCRKWGGGPLLAVECGDAVTFDGGDTISVFDSSEWAERGFCSRCGTHLFYRLKQAPLYAIPVGLFDGDASWTLAEQVFIDQKPAFYSFAQQTDELTGEQLFARHAG